MVCDEITLLLAGMGGHRFQWQIVPNLVDQKQGNRGLRESKTGSVYVCSAEH